MSGIKVRHLIPDIHKISEERLKEITRNNSHPTRDEVRNLYTEIFLNKGIDFHIGDIIELSSKEFDFIQYNYISQNGIEIVETPIAWV